MGRQVLRKHSPQQGIPTSRTVQRTVSNPVTCIMVGWRRILVKSRLPYYDHDAKVNSKLMCRTMEFSDMSCHKVQIYRARTINDGQTPFSEQIHIC
jgi:hypothetical protein